MSLFGTMMSKIFGHHAQAQTPQSGQQPAAQQSASGAGAGAQQSAAPSAGSAQPAGAAARQGPAAAQAAGQSSQPPGTQALQSVDVEQVLENMAAKNPQKLNWRTSIVDLMKLLDMDSSLSARQTLAHELGYTGDMNDSAAMNIWLHKQVMTRFAENGGKVPQSLRH